jgi:TRAP-type C4-dicarboxylate transport system substrate-binding protein
MISRTILGGVAFAALTAFASVAGAETWTAVTIQPSAQSVSVPFFQSIFDEIEKQTGGDLKIDLKLSSQLPISASTYTQAVGDGIVQIADDGYAAGNVPIVGILKLPMLIQGMDQAKKAAEVALPAISAAYEKDGALVLGSYFMPSQVPFGRSVIQSLADLKGLKLETDSPQQEHFVKALGGIGIVVSPADVPSAIQRGTLDAVITASAGGGKIWGDMLSSNYRLPISEFPVMFAVNKAAFEALSPENQKIVRDVVAERLPKLTDVFAEDEAKVTKALADKGMKITEPSAEEFAQATEMMKPYWDEWAASQGPRTQELLAKIREALGK